MSDDVPEPAASVVVLNFNGGEAVLRCVESVLSQATAPLELLIVDNASEDSSVAAITSRFTGIRVLRMGRNLGYSGGMNRGIEATRGEFVFLLNCDVELNAGYVSACLHRLSEDPTLGGVSGKMLKPPRNGPPVIDGAGYVVYRNGRAVDRGEGETDQGQYDEASEVFGLTGTAPCYRRSMLDDVRLGTDYFDEDFFAYFEDLDLSWRARLKGWRFMYEPLATAFHQRGASGGSRLTRIMAANHRNRLFVLVKNDHPRGFLRRSPGIAYTEGRSALHLLITRPAALIRAWWGFLALLPRMIRKRRRIQSGRTMAWRELEKWFEAYPYRGVIRRARQRATFW
ncbi:MAG: glycosyltransferase family 2 protein [Actinomycetota bacterium]